MTFVVTEGDDPYMEGGRPIAAYYQESHAWDRMAEEVALAAWDTWERHYLRHGRTRDDVMQDEASVYAVTAVPLEGSVTFS